MHSQDDYNDHGSVDGGSIVPLEMLQDARTEDMKGDDAPSLSGADMLDDLQEQAAEAMVSREGATLPEVLETSMEDEEEEEHHVDANSGEVVFKDFPRHGGNSFFKYRPKVEEKYERRTGHVFFEKVFIREYNLTVGDNPSCTDSLPIMLDWDHGPVRIWAIDDYEKVKLMFPIPDDAEGMARRLSFDERRQLLIDVADYNDRKIRYEERAYLRQRQADVRAAQEGTGSGSSNFFSFLFSSSSETTSTTASASSSISSNMSSTSSTTTTTSPSSSQDEKDEPPEEKEN